jgi:beta-glucosidase
MSLNLLPPIMRNTVFCSLPFPLLLIAGLTTAIAVQPDESSAKAPDRLIGQKVEETLSRMSLEDKLAELQGIRPNQLVENGKVSLEKCRALMPHGIGQLCQFTSSLQFTPEQVRTMVNDIQHYLVTETPARIPAIFHEEMITGFPSPGCTLYPQHIGMGCSWNPDLVEEGTRHTAQTSRNLGGTLALSPMVDLTRTPAWGRNEEGFGEDPVLTSRLALAFVKGLQGDDLSKGVAATTKHFAGYGGSYGSEEEFMGEYLMPHEAGISLGDLSCVMPNYGFFKGVPSHANRELLTGILRGDLGFRGLTLSDYGAVTKLNKSHHVAESDQDAGVKALNAGLDVELSNGICFPLLLEAIHRGLVSMQRIDEAVRRSLTLKARLGLLDKHPLFCMGDPMDPDPAENRKIAYESACQSLVLLKNNGILPLRKGTKVALVGPNSDSIYSLLGDYSYQCLSLFFWSIKPDAVHPKLVTLLDGLKSRLGKSGELLHERGCDWNNDADMALDTKNGDKQILETAKRFKRVIAMVHDGLPPPDEQKALRIASQSDVIVAAVGENVYLSGEGRGRPTLGLPSVQEAFVEKLLATGKPVVLVLFGGHNIAIGKLENRCAAIIQAWYPGEEGGNAVADLLIGAFNPSGRLCVSFPSADAKLPTAAGSDAPAAASPSKVSASITGVQALPAEMRAAFSYTDNYQSPLRPLYPFGYGLSYTTFAYSDLKVPDSAPITDESIPVTLKVKNTGSRAGTEVVQLYVSPTDPNSPLKPIRLHGFRRVELAPGEEKTVTFGLSPEQLCSWRDGSWTVEPGTYRIRAGSSSADLPLDAKITFKGEKKVFKKRTHFWCS